MKQAIIFAVFALMLLATLGYEGWKWIWKMMGE